MTEETKAALRAVGQHAGMKIMSARWFCTIAAMWIWAYCAYKGLLGAEFNASIITLIVKSYFDRKDVE